MLAVEVGDEMLSAFRQVEYGFKIDDFSACRTDVGVSLGKQLKDSAVVFLLVGL